MAFAMGENPVGAMQAMTMAVYVVLCVQPLWIAGMIVLPSKVTRLGCLGYGVGLACLAAVLALAVFTLFKSGWTVIFACGAALFLLPLLVWWLGLVAYRRHAMDLVEVT